MESNRAGQSIRSSIWQPMGNGRRVLKPTPSLLMSRVIPLCHRPSPPFSERRYRSGKRTSKRGLCRRSSPIFFIELSPGVLSCPNASHDTGRGTDRKIAINRPLLNNKCLPELDNHNRELLQGEKYTGFGENA